MSNQALDTVLRSVRPALRAEPTFENEREQLVYDLLGEVNDHVQLDLNPTATPAEVARVKQLVKLALPRVDSRTPILPVVESVRPALQNTPTTEKEREQFVYDLLREVYDYGKFDENGPNADTAERTRLAAVINAALPKL
ncbi:hypothetical protein [Curtobacterium flaccumfaciens]|uniref:hypothetical protein n=1 Tax=Curtobacterium flaccumfaciens TaxID=2035 RepID=UPI00188BF117|nr:hypothetical protein [Curtobacterium flaccumfaciens]MBF4629591.1 hypothetical protein [Curtobacterium flaccumfaciens]